MRGSISNVRFKTWWFSILLLLPFGIHGQSSSIKEEIAIYWEKQQWDKVIARYSDYVVKHPSDNKALYEYALALYYDQSYEKSLNNFQKLHDARKRGKKDEYAFYVARCFHLMSNFEEAKGWYKKALQVDQLSDQNRSFCYLAIQQCALGNTLRYAVKPLVVENMGVAINSDADDCQLLESPNYPGRIYFSSAQREKIVDQFDSTGQLVASRQSQDLDLYAAELQGGQWQNTAVFEHQLNSEADELLLGFMNAGQEMIFYQPEKRQIAKKNFEKAGTQPLVWTSWLSTTSFSGFQIFTDSIIIFAAELPDGYGGFDLYWSKHAEDRWSDPINFGPIINSSKDEIYPFLCKNGRDLYFSSNGEKCVGGFDIFTSHFDDKKLHWSSPENIGLPINSPANEINFIQSNTGLQGFFVSDRYKGFGRYDIYSIIYQKPQQEQLYTSFPAFFGESENFNLFQEGYPGDVISDKAEESEEIFRLPNLFYNEGSPVMTPRQEESMQELIGIMKGHSHLKVEIISHSDQSQVSNFDLFFSTKRAEEVANYLVNNGINSNRIFLKGLGGNYPMAENERNGIPNQSAQYYNRRLDFTLHKTENLPLKIEETILAINENIRLKNYDEYLTKRAGLNYTVQFADLTQMYKGSAIEQLEDVAVHSTANSERYIYTAGIIPTYQEALNYRKLMQDSGITQLVIQPMLDGLILNKGAINTKLLSEYPDLKNYVLSLN